MRFFILLNFLIAYLPTQARTSLGVSVTCATPLDSFKIEQLATSVSELYPDVIVSDGYVLNGVTFSYFGAVYIDGCNSPGYRGYSGSVTWYIHRDNNVRGYWILYSYGYGAYGYYINRNKTVLPPTSGWENADQATDFLLFGRGSVNISGGVDAQNDGIEVTHYHQIEQNPSFNTQEQLAVNNGFKVCADGSTASVFVVTGSHISSGGLQISGNSANDVELSGQLSLISGDENRLVYKYKHPNRIDGSGSSSTVRFELTQYSASCPTLRTKSYSMTIYRSPVLMVHGLWSKPTSFSAMETTLRNSSLYAVQSLIKRADYSTSNNAAFISNVPKIKNEIDGLIKSLRIDHIAAGNVDFVGHSMGGILGRAYLQSDTYQCGLHKLITINTPHSGSQLANLIVDSRTTLPYVNDILCNKLLPALPDVVRPACDGGAIDDLRVDSPPIKDTLNNIRRNFHTAPSHTIATVERQTPQEFASQIFPITVGQYNPLVIKPKTLLDGLLPYLLIKTDILTLFDGLTSATYDGLNDWIVSVVSQQGGMTGDCTTLIENQQHVGSPANQQVINRVVTLLTAAPNSSSFCSSFNPSPIDKPIFPVITPDGTVVIESPQIGKVVTPGASLTISARGTNLTELRALVDDGSDKIQVGARSDSTADFVITTNQSTGRNEIVVIGKTQAGNIVAASSYFIVGNVVDSDCKSLYSGDWSDSGTWSCGHVPTITDQVIIGPAHVITISGTVQARKLIYSGSGGIIKFTSTGNKLMLGSQ